MTHCELPPHIACSSVAVSLANARIQKGGTGGLDPPTLKNHKNIGLLSNTSPDPLKNHKATKTAFNVGPLSARQRNAIYMAFR